MNTRLQVEHPVTEAITGLDLVEWQLRVACGEPLPLGQDEIDDVGPRRRGAAVTPRIRRSGFLPSTGPIVASSRRAARACASIAGVEQGSVISPYYDSMIAKLIAIGAGPRRRPSRAWPQALEDDLVAGPRTNAAFLHALLVHPALRRRQHGHRADRPRARQAHGRDAQPQGDRLSASPQLLWRAYHDSPRSAPAGRRGDGYSAWNASDAFQLGGPRRQRITVLVDGAPVRAEVEWSAAGRTCACRTSRVSPARRSCTRRRRPTAAACSSRADANPALRLCTTCARPNCAGPPTMVDVADAAGDGASVRAPIIGRVAKLFVASGDAVAKGDRIAVVEAMKMEHVLHAPRDGTVESVAVKEGEQVVQGAVVAVLSG